MWRNLKTEIKQRAELKLTEQKSQKTEVESSYWKRQNLAWDLSIARHRNWTRCQVLNKKKYIVQNDNDKSMWSVLVFYRKIFFCLDLKVFSLFNCLIFLGSSLNKLVTLQVKEFLFPEISTIGPLSLHARNKRFFLVQSLILSILESFCYVGLDNISWQFSSQYVL